MGGGGKGGVLEEMGGGFAGLQLEAEDYDPLDDDELENEDLEEKNRELAPYSGIVQEGIMVPIGFPTMFSMPIPKVETHVIDQGAEEEEEEQKTKKDEGDDKGAAGDSMVVEKKESVFADVQRRKRPSAKDEPVEAVLAPVAAPAAAGAGAGDEPGLYMPDAGDALDALRFPPRSAARHVLASDGAPLFLQLPGIVPLRENRLAWPNAPPAGGAFDGRRDGTESAETIVAAARERERGLATDLRVVHAPGETHKAGKLMFYRSGRVVLRYGDGSTADVTVGAACRNVLQLLCVSSKAKDGEGVEPNGAGRMEDEVNDDEDDEDDDNMCEEFNASVRSRLVCIPSLESLVPTRHAVSVVKKQDPSFR